MSLRTRRAAAAATGLALTLALSLPAPSQAAGLPGTAATFFTRAWPWLESLGLAKPAAVSRRPAARWAKEGSMIDPNGRTGTAPAAPPTSATSVPSGGSDSGGGQS